MADLTAMLATMPSRAASGLDAAAMLRIYEDDLRGLPVGKLREAIRDFRTGKLGSGRFAPTAAEIAMAVRERMAAAADHAERLARQARLEEETLRERGAAQARREAVSVDERRATVERLLGRLPGGEQQSRADWVGTEDEAAGRLELAREAIGVRNVETFSDQLAAQLRGEAPIGVGRLGLRPVAWAKQEGASDAD